MNEAHIISAKDYEDLLTYIERYWSAITCEHPKDKFSHFGLPHPFICPNDGIFKDDQFYWDSYFTVLGLVRSDRIELAKGMVDNFIFMQKRFQLIPMRNRWYNLGTSQIPFLTSMIAEVFAVTGDRRWRRKAMAATEKELSEYWMNKNLTEQHIVYRGLSRYCDHYITHLAAEHESGWDMTSRFHDHCLDYLPVDLNCALYKYETDLAEFYKANHKPRQSDAFLVQAEKRQRAMTSLMWNHEFGFFFDYDYKHKKRGTFYSLAGFYPLWAKLATHAQAKKMVEHLERFEYPGGLANTQATGLSEEYKQHDFPNGWPPQQWIVIQGLLNYGYHADAFRIAMKFLSLNQKVLKKTGRLWEKYNVVTGAPGESERYPTQSGFAWTNAIVLWLLDQFSPSKGL
ncbi:MAG TPA: trehalase family glycosidase [Candidatus Kapabacteria bacterium]|nr:trehalase family glycosidase [Candidatus Kapabacteria bacterium]